MCALAQLDINIGLIQQCAHVSRSEAIVAVNRLYAITSIRSIYIVFARLSTELLTRKCVEKRFAEA